MNILVAGGAGFLGSNLVRRLLKEGETVTVLDNFITGKRENLPEDEKNLTVIEHDITHPLPDFPDSFNIIVNMACPASPPAYQRFPLETLRTSSLGTENLLILSKDLKARFVQASTSEVYGDPLVHPQVESYWGNVNPYGARSMYDEGKRYGEAIIWAYRKVHKVNTGIIRIFNTYGPFMSPDDGRVITNFLHQALEGKELTVYGDGKGTRSFCYVDDQVEAWVRMIHLDAEGPINVGNPQEFSLLELVDVLSTVLGRKLAISFKPCPLDDPRRRKPDIKKAKEILGWEPKVSLEEGLKKMVEWIRSQKS